MSIEDCRKKIFVSWPGYSMTDPQTGERLAAAGYEVVLHPKLASRSPAELSEILGEAVGAIVSTDPFTREVIEKHRNLAVIARVGVGTDSIDLTAAKEHGVYVTIAPGLNADTVADHTLALILALVRNVIDQNESVKRGGWNRVGNLTPTELCGKTVGLLGAGTIGRKVIRRLSGFDARVLYFDPFVREAEGATKVNSLKELLAVSDVVSLHVPLTIENRGIVGADEIHQMKRTAILVNTARGALVDQLALFSALKNGWLKGAALDVFEEEPPAFDVLREIPNLVCSPHLAGLSEESIRRMTISATNSVLAVLSGEIPAAVVNPLAAARVGNIKI
jgi:phosphoglycerate dehydrogenase-like enzyme